MDASVDVVVPVYNETASLARKIRQLRSYLDTSFPFPATVTIADNASTDGTFEAATALAAELRGVRTIHLDQKGRGRALKAAWLESAAPVVAYMDVDLSTGLEALLPLVAPLVTGHSDVAIGSRLARGARVVRAPRREFVSRCYNRLLHLVLRNDFSDAQCGFKAMRADVARRLLPLVEDGEWFFDTELLVLAERHGLRIHEVPVDWVDDPDSRVDVLRTALDDLHGVWRLIRHPSAMTAAPPTRERTAGQLAADAGRFARVGTVSTLAWLVLTVALHAAGLPVAAANLVALGVCASCNLVAHRRLNDVPPVRSAADLWGVALGSLLAGMAATSAAVGVVMVAGGSWQLQVLAAMAAGALVSLGRFLLLRATLWRRIADTRPDLPDKGAELALVPDLPAAEPLPPPDTTRPRPSWERPALALLLAATAALYLWGLGRAGWGNAFYSAAVQAGTRSWKAFFFGSFDASNFITVDKPPASLWVMELSARIFGLNSWSILVPEALEGVAAVGLLYATVKRWFGAPAGLVAGGILALTPVATLMFRYNNPDALLVLLLVGSAYAVTRALERGGTWWLVLAGFLVGTGFVTKMLQAFLVVPAIGLVYLLAGPPRLLRRIGQLVAFTMSLLVSSLWWVLAVELTPAADRPYIGGSQDNSLWNLIFGYNGFGRLTGNETGSVTGAGIGGGAARGAGFSPWGATGWSRLFSPSMGGQISWLIPAALVLLAGGLWYTRRAPRTDRARAALLFWGLWLVVTGLVFSFGEGIIHPYYTVALAPAVGALVAVGGAVAWRHRSDWNGRVVLATAIAASAAWAVVLLDRSPGWNSWLQPAVLVAAVLAVGVLLLGPLLSGRKALGMGVAGVGIGLGLAAVLAGPAAYSVATAATPESGAIPSAGPAISGGGAGGGGAGGGFGRPLGGLAGGGFPALQGRFPAGLPGAATGGRPPFGAAGPFANGTPPTGGTGGTGGTGTGTGGTGRTGASSGRPGVRGSGLSRGGGGGAGSLLGASTPGTAVVRLLERDASRYTWVAAAVGANSAAGFQLATDDPVMAIGGFNGTDPTPTLAQFERLVAAHEVHWFIASGGGGRGLAGPSGGSTSASEEITSWVESHFSSVTLDGVTLYRLSS